MARYFIDISYKGTNYAGFQIQQNARTVQAVIEESLTTLCKQPVEITGSSRTDAGVHAIQNMAHFDAVAPLHQQFLYKINALLPRDIVINQIYSVHSDTHARFDAISRTYEYVIYRHKDPFMEEVGYYFPYAINDNSLSAAAEMIKGYTDFSAFAKRNPQVKTFNCRIDAAEWLFTKGEMVFRITANRFLRGMVRGLTGTMLLVGREKLTLEEFRAVIESGDNSKANFGVPGRGLFLKRVDYPPEFFGF
jgi:tRNA pseudouridine38-40 synthase